MLKSWKIGDKLVLDTNPTYWGTRAARRGALSEDRRYLPADPGQRGPAPGAADAVRSRATTSSRLRTSTPSSRTANLKIVNRPAFNVGYVGMNQSAPPMNNLIVRQAVAYGLDRTSVVNGSTADADRRRTVPAAVGVRLREEGRAGLPVQPGQGEGAAPAGGADAAGADRLLVSDERVAAVHARPVAQRRGVRREPRAVRLQGDVPLSARGARTTSPRCRAERPRSSARLDGRLR